MSEFNLKKFHCEFMGICPDIEKLEESKKTGYINEDLADQYEELCTIGGFKCSTRESYQERGEI